MGALGVLLPNVLRSPDPARATCLSAPQAEHEEPTGPGLPLRSRQGQPSPLCALLDEVGRVLQPGPTPSAGFHQARRFGAAAMLRRPFGGPPLLALAWHRGFGAFGLVYCAIFRTSFDLALLTWTLEHPFVHELEGSFRHNWNTCTMVQEKAGQQLLLDDHAYHHACPGLPQSKGEEHFQDTEKFVSCQLKHGHLMLRVDTYQINPIINRILGAMARAMFSKDYQTVRSFVAFRNLSVSRLRSFAQPFLLLRQIDRVAPAPRKIEIKTRNPGPKVCC